MLRSRIERRQWSFLSAVVGFDWNYSAIANDPRGYQGNSLSTITIATGYTEPINPLRHYPLHCCDARYNACMGIERRSNAGQTCDYQSLTCDRGNGQYRLWRNHNTRYRLWRNRNGWLDSCTARRWNISEVEGAPDMSVTSTEPSCQSEHSIVSP